MPCLTEREGDTLLAVHLQPRARRTELAGLRADALKVRVAAPPVDNAANEALCAFLARRLGVPASRVRLERGATSRAKLVCLAGLTAAEVRARLNLPKAES